MCFILKSRSIQFLNRKIYNHIHSLLISTVLFEQMLFLRPPFNEINFPVMYNLSY